MTSKGVAKAARQGGEGGRWVGVCNACSAGTSVVCMGSMGAAVAAAGASGAAGAAAMAGMSSASGAPLITLLLSAVGLDILNHVPDPPLQQIFVAVLLVGAGSAYLAYRTSGRIGPLALTLASGLALYGGIYLWLSEPLYYLGLAGILAAAAWAIVAARRPAMTSAPS